MTNIYRHDGVQHLDRDSPRGTMIRIGNHKRGFNLDNHYPDWEVAALPISSDKRMIQRKICFLITFRIRPGQSATGLPMEKSNGIVIRLTSLDTLPDQNADSESQSVTIRIHS